MPEEPTPIQDHQNRLVVHSTERRRLEVYDKEGGSHETRQHLWTTPGVTGMGWDGGTVWVCNPSEYSVRQYDVDTGEPLRSIGWDTEHERPQSVHREGDLLWVVTAMWWHRFRIGDPEGVGASEIVAGSTRKPIIWAKVRNAGDLW